MKTKLNPISDTTSEPSSEEIEYVVDTERGLLDAIKLTNLLKPATNKIKSVLRGGGHGKEYCGGKGGIFGKMRNVLRNKARKVGGGLKRAGDRAGGGFRKFGHVVGGRIGKANDVIGSGLGRLHKGLGNKFEKIRGGFRKVGGKFGHTIGGAKKVVWSGLGKLLGSSEERRHHHYHEHDHEHDHAHDHAARS